MDKQSRKNKVLEIILRAHMESAEPVGSKYISDILGVSSATVRNIMVDLEEDGYLRQPHTSAGRVPTAMAYRLYVSTLMIESNIIHEVNKLYDNLFSRYQNLADVIERLSDTISRLTGYTSFVIYPKDHIYMDGACYILEQPEFNDLTTIRRIFRLLDAKEKLLDIMNHYISNGVLKINIGKENKIEEFEQCSVVTASYVVRGKIVGGVGIIGPIRMNYRRVVPVIKFFSESVSRMLERMYA